MKQKNIVVIGAGVAGLTTALLLSKNPQYKIVVVAKHMPGDYDIEYASPWAGANYMPVSPRNTRQAEWEKASWKYFEELARNFPEAGVHLQDCEIRTRIKDTDTSTADWFSELLSPNPWFKDVVPNFRNLEEHELPSGIDSATRFTSICINTAIYLPYLVSQCLKSGVLLKRATLSHVLDCVSHSLHPGKHVNVIVNCTGLGARNLGGVEDISLIPARGQIVVVRNETIDRKMINISGTDDGQDEACYIMSRAAGGGTILGGCYQKGNWDPIPDSNMALRIMKRAVDACPALTQGRGIEALDVVRHGVGLRPVREGGTRVERENIEGIWVVHNYGAGGAGYQNSFGCASTASNLVDEVIKSSANL